MNNNLLFLVTTATVMFACNDATANASIINDSAKNHADPFKLALKKDDENNSQEKASFNLDETLKATNEEISSLIDTSLFSVSSNMSTSTASSLINNIQNGNNLNISNDQTEYTVSFGNENQVSLDEYALSYGNKLNINMEPDKYDFYSSYKEYDEEFKMDNKDDLYMSAKNKTSENEYINNYDLSSMNFTNELAAIYESTISNPSLTETTYEKSINNFDVNEFYGKKVVSQIKNIKNKVSTSINEWSNNLKESSYSNEVTNIYRYFMVTNQSNNQEHLNMLNQIGKILKDKFNIDLELDDNNIVSYTTILNILNIIVPQSISSKNEKNDYLVNIDFNQLFNSLTIASKEMITNPNDYNLTDNTISILKDLNESIDELDYEDTVFSLKVNVNNNGRIQDISYNTDNYLPSSDIPLAHNTSNNYYENYVNPVASSYNYLDLSINKSK